MTDEELDAEARALVAEAMEPFVATVPVELLEQIRILLEVDLVASTDGRRLLRSALADPAVDRSGDVSRAGDVDGKKAGGSA